MTRHPASAAPKIRFAATVGEEPKAEVEVALV